MPKLSLTMKEGSVGKWYKKEGDRVEKGESIVEVVSEKATYDLEAPSSGILQKILVEQGVDASVNAVLAFITASDEIAPIAEIQAEERPQAVEGFEKRVLASPAAKRLAKEQGIDLSTVKGSGPEGRIVEEDVRSVMKETKGVLPRVKVVIPLSGFKKTSAERVSISFRTAPHSTIMMEVDVSKAKELHEKLGVSYTAILAESTAKALTEHSIINSTLESGNIKIFEDVNVGVAVATENGLIVPVLHEADKKSVKEIDTLVVKLTDQARQGKLSKEELSGGTFTITNLGMYGVDFFTPIINPPEAAILAVGKITEKPLVINGRIEVKPTMIMSLSYDHRIVDGAPAAKFLQRIKEKIETLS
jgi:pyruvate dehydrogenase E2 component (dihydrolipoamide acetyltransferase)